jgi:hypothetical protein
MTPEFIADATVACARDEVKHIASTDIASYPHLQHVQACLVRTEYTGGVALMLNEQAPGPNGPVADAVAAMVKAVIQPGKTRH